jgi:hypothetical protein
VGRIQSPGRIETHQLSSAHFWHLSDMLVTQPTKQTADNTQSVICPMFRQHYSRNSLAIGNCENAHAIVRHVKGGLGAQNFNRN